MSSTRGARWAYATLAAIGVASLLYDTSKTSGQYYYGDDAYARMKAMAKILVGGESDGASSSLSSTANEFRYYDGNNDRGVFRGAREWNEYWTYASGNKGGRTIRDGGGTSFSRANDDHLAANVEGSSHHHHRHVHDDHVLSVVESVTEKALEHVDDTKRRYEGVGALPDFYSRGIGWIWDVSFYISCHSSSCGMCVLLAREHDGEGSHYYYAGRTNRY